MNPAQPVGLSTVLTRRPPWRAGRRISVGRYGRAGLARARPSETDPPALLEWTSAPLQQALDVVGDIEVELRATSTAIDTAWIITLQDVAPDGTVVDVTAGWLRAGLRRVDPGRSSVGSPELGCRDADVVVPGSLTTYRIPLVTTARRFAAGHRLRLVVTSDVQDASTPPSWGSGTRRSAPAASTPSTRRRGSCCPFTAGRRESSGVVCLRDR